MSGRFTLCYVLALVLGASGAARAAPVRYAGIEVGPKWVTGVVVEVDSDAPQQGAKVIAAKETVTTVGLLDKGRFRPELVTATANDVAALVERFRAADKENVAVANIRVFVGGALAEVPNRGDLEAAILAKAKLKPAYLTVAEEVRLSLDGLALQQQATRGLVLVVGDGDLKGGYDTGTGTVETFAVPFGTVNFTTAARAANGETFAAKAASAKAAEVSPALKAALREKTPLKQKTPVTLTGGAAWALVTILKPASVGQPLVPVAAADVAAFKAKLAENPGRFPTVDLSTVGDADARTRAARELARVRDAYTAENLVAGAELLDAVFAEFAFGNAPVSFARGGDRGPALAAVTPEAVRVAARPKAPTPVPEPPKMPPTVTSPGAPAVGGEPGTYPPTEIVHGPRIVASPSARFCPPRKGLLGRLRNR